MEQRSKCPSFDSLHALYQHDAQAFEELRRQLLWEAIEDAPASRRAALEALVTRIEANRASAATPIEAASRAFDMMMESFGDLQDHWRRAYHLMAELQATVAIERARLS